MKLKKVLSFVMCLLLLLCCCGCGSNTSEPIAIKVLILPKFETGEMSGDSCGEAQHFYEGYLRGGEEYDIFGGKDGNKLYVQDGITLYVTGMGKVNSTLSTTQVLTDSRFDFSNALILSVGCAGSAKGYGVMGDVYVISATVDGELGHCVDSRDLTDKDQITTWYSDSEYDDSGSRLLDADLTKKVYDLVKDVKIETTETTRKYMSAAFNGEEWAVRDPQVLLGTSCTSDNYWKGETWHANALKTVSYYGCPDPYAATEMEDNAVAITVDRLGLLDHLVILRDSVNEDVFMNGATPDSLWDPDYDNSLEAESGIENADIFETANCNSKLQ